jgi:hypothetical protein
MLIRSLPVIGQGAAEVRLDLLAHVLAGVADEQFCDVRWGQRPAEFGDHPGIHPHGNALAVDKRAVTVEDDEFYPLPGAFHGRENTGMATADVAITLSGNDLTDEESDILLDEAGELEAGLAALPGLRSDVRRQFDPSDPTRQGAELIVLALDLIPVALESLLVVIQSWRERRKEKEAAAQARGVTISVTIKTDAGEVTIHVDGGQDQTLPAASALLAQLSGFPVQA